MCRPTQYFAFVDQNLCREGACLELVRRGKQQTEAKRACTTSRVVGVHKRELEWDSLGVHSLEVQRAQHRLVNWETER